MVAKTEAVHQDTTIAQKTQTRFLECFGDTEKSLVEEEDGELDWGYCHGVGDFVADNGLGLLSSPPWRRMVRGSPGKAL